MSDKIMNCLISGLITNVVVLKSKLLNPKPQRVIQSIKRLRF